MCAKRYHIAANHISQDETRLSYNFLGDILYDIESKESALIKLVLQNTEILKLENDKFAMNEIFRIAAFPRMF